MKIENILKKKNFCSDSRLLKKNDIFFDFLSSSKKINPYIKNIIDKSPSLIISSRPLDYKNVLLRKNVKKFYFSSIKKKYQNITKNIYAVTGTNGKTSVANFFYQLNILNKIPCANIGTLGYFYNNKLKKNNLTTPDNLNLFKFLDFIKRKGINKVILEASSHGLAQGRLDGLKFKSVVFTNFSQDHLDYHKSMQSYFNAKLILFKKNLLKNSNIICDDYLAQRLFKKKISKKKFNFILQNKKKIPFKIVCSKPVNTNTKIKINYKNKIYSFNLNIVGDFQIKNLYQAIVLSLLSGLDKNKILKVLPKIRPIKGRLNIIKNRHKIICIDYAHTPDGLEKVIKTLKNHFKKNVNIVFGCGGNRDIGKRFKMGQVVNKYCKQVIITDDNPRNENPKQITKQIFQSARRGQIIQNRKMAIKTGIKITKKNEILLIAGKGHENYQIFKNRKIFFSDFEVVSNNL